jgi:hypothetical protein
VDAVGIAYTNLLGDGSKCVKKQYMHVWGTGNFLTVMDTSLQCETLQNHFFPTIRGMGANTEETLFQQDEARLHKANDVLYFLSKHLYIGAVSNQ